MPETPAERTPSESRDLQRRFESAATRLPTGEGPLPVAQYITTGGSNVAARLDPKDFFCGRSIDDRIEAINDLYGLLAERLGAAGAGFRLTVGELTSRIDEYPVYGRADESSASLTQVGRGTGPC